MQVERDKLRIKLDKLRSGKTFEELDEGLDLQVCFCKKLFMGCLVLAVSKSWMIPFLIWGF